MVLNSPPDTAFLDIEIKSGASATLYDTISYIKIDTYDDSSSPLVNGIFGDSGTNTLKVNGYLASSVSLGDGDDTFTNQYITGQLNGSAIVVDRYGIVGVTRGDVSLGAGNDTFTNTTNSLVGVVSGSGTATINLGADNDTLTNSGTINVADIILGDGTNTVTNNTGASIKVDLTTITGGSGVDTVNNSGTITGHIDLLGSNDVISNTSTGTIDITGTAIDMGDNDDTLTNA